MVVTVNIGDASAAVLTAAAPGRRERVVAVIVMLVSAFTLAAVAPSARTPLGELKPFIPAYQSALLITDLITAVLLYGQFGRSRSAALLVLASGYLFDAVIIIPHTLSFPGIFTPTGLMSAGPQTTAWLYTFWHGGFAIFILAYAFLSGWKSSLRTNRIGLAIAVCMTGVLLLVVGLAALATAGHDFLPIVMRGNDYSLIVKKGVSPTVCALSLAAIAALWRRRNSCVLDMWLIVVLCAWLCDVILSAVIGSARYDLGFYAGRAYGLLSASFLLIVLLVETNSLQSELMKSREALAQARHFEAIGALTGGVAHDFNNLLMIMSGALDMIQRHPEDRTRVARWTASALAAAARGGKLTQQLLTFARRQVNRAQTVDLNQLLSDFELLLRQAAGPNVEIVFDLSPVLRPARFDPSQFEAAVLNLVVNARDAMPRGGRITIETWNASLAAALPDHGDEVPAGEYMLVVVRDTGTGMTREVAAKAINPYFTTKEVGRGAGLGLSQVYGFAQSSGGHLSLESEVGAGTTVKLYLPKSPEAAPAEPTAASSIPMRAALEAEETILVVEDDPEVLALAVEGLKELGYQVLISVSAEQALDMLRSTARVDVLFSDVVMPGGMNGVQLAVEARRIRSRIKVLLTSGYTAEALKARGIPSDLDILEKPYRRHDLAEKLRLVS